MYVLISEQQNVKQVEDTENKDIPVSGHEKSEWMSQCALNLQECSQYYIIS